MIELSEKAERVLMSAKYWTDGADGKPVYIIARTLGFETWATCGEKGKRADIAELYRNGLIAEWLNPWSGRVYLTSKGVDEFRERGGDLSHTSTGL